MQCGHAPCRCVLLHWCRRPLRAAYPVQSGDRGVQQPDHSARPPRAMDRGAGVDGLNMCMVQHRFGAIYDAVTETLGVKTVGDLKYVTQDDLESIVVKPVQARRFAEIIRSEGGPAASPQAPRLPSSLVQERGEDEAASSAAVDGDGESDAADHWEGGPSG